MSPTIFSERRFRFQAADGIWILLLAAFSLAPLFSRTVSGGGEWARIRTPAGVYRYRLDRDREVTVAGHGGRMRLAIQGGSIRVLQSDCPLKICKKNGRIKGKGEQIVCVPLRIEVAVEGRSPDGDVRCR